MMNLSGCERTFAVFRGLAYCGTIEESQRMASSIGLAYCATIKESHRILRTDSMEYS